MDHTTLLKYGIPLDDAIRLDHDLKVLKIVLEEKQEKIKYNNAEAIKLISQAEPNQEKQIVHDIETLNINPRISKVCFLVDNKNVCIDDPDIIEKLRNVIAAKYVESDNYKHIHMDKSIGQNKKKRGQQPNTPLLKDIILELLPYMKGTDYKKRIQVGKILSKYLDSFKYMKNDKDKLPFSDLELHNKIYNIISRS